MWSPRAPGSAWLAFPAYLLGSLGCVWVSDFSHLPTSALEILRAFLSKQGKLSRGSQGLKGLVLRRLSQSVQDRVPHGPRAPQAVHALMP